MERLKRVLVKLVFKILVDKKAYKKAMREALKQTSSLSDRAIDEIVNDDARMEKYILAVNSPRT